MRNKVDRKIDDPAAMGLALSEAIREKMRESGTHSRDFAELIGLSPTYVNTLMSGKQGWSGTGRIVKKKVANFLGLPYINVLMLAGEVEPCDFLFEDSLEKQLDGVYAMLRKDQVWGQFLKQKAEWDSLPKRFQIVVALMYEQITSTSILEKAQMIKVVQKRKSAGQKAG